MKRVFIALWLISSGMIASAAAEIPEFDWDGGDLQFQFTALPYQQREPKINQEEYKTLNELVELVKQQRTNDAIAAVKIHIARAPSAAMWFTLAQLQQQQKLESDAIESLQQALKLLPQFTRAHQSLGMILTRQGEFLAARPHLQLAVSHGAPAQFYAMLGYGYLQDHQPQAAKAAYSQALMLAGDNEQWQQGLLHAAMASGDDALAGSMTDQLLAKKPTDPQLHRLRASLAQRQRNWPQAIASLEAAQQLAPNDEVQWQLAQIYLDQGYFQLAQPNLRQLIAKGIEGREQRLLEVSEYLIVRQQLAEADELLNALVNGKSVTSAQRSRGLTNQAKVLAQRQPKDSVSRQISLLNRALQLDPLNGAALIALARHYEITQQPQAEALYRRAAAVPAVQVEALQRHAQLLLTQEAYQRAQQLLQQAVKQAPNDKQLRDNLALVSRMAQSQG